MIFASDNWAGASERVITALAEAAAQAVRPTATTISPSPSNGASRRSSSARSRCSSSPAGPRRTRWRSRPTRDRAASSSVTAKRTYSSTRRARPNSSAAARRSSVSTAQGARSRRRRSPRRSRRFPEGNVHHGRPVAVSLTQITELGAAYAAGGGRGAGEDRARGAGRRSTWTAHVSPMRWLRSNRSPADLTWRAGVDVLSFGGTKNGCVAAEAVVFFDPEHARDVGFARQRAGQGFSKNWFIAAQFEAYLADGHWLDLARHANAMASRLAVSPGKVGQGAACLRARRQRGLRDHRNGCSTRACARPVPSITPGRPTACPSAERPGSGEVIVRLVTSWQTSAPDVDRFAETLAG